MKTDPLRLAMVFHEAGMLDEESYQECHEKFKRHPRTLWEVLSQDVRDVDFLFGLGKQKKMPSDLMQALSHSVHLSNEELLAILTAFRPSVEDLLAALEAAEVLTETGAAILEDIGLGPDVYTQLVSRGYIQTRNVTQTVATFDGTLRRTNRILLALDVLKAHKILPAATCDEMLTDFLENGCEPVNVSAEKIIEFIESDPELNEIPPEEITPTEEESGLFPISFLRQNRCMPLRIKDNVLFIVVSEPFHIALADTLSLLTGMPVALGRTSSKTLTARMAEVFAQDHVPRVENGEMEHLPRRRTSDFNLLASEGVDYHSAVDLVSSIIDGGVRHGSTDIHLEPYGHNLRVRYRIDGLLRHILNVPSRMVHSVISRIKVLAHLNLTERRHPQDGHFALRLNRGTFDFRVSTLPTHIGEKIVIRILDESKVMLSLEDLGMGPGQSETVRKWITHPHGLILVTGPTGSGKTSTLYAALNIINDETKNIVTIEDPVEYQLGGINQVQVDSATDLNFANGLRAILRQDPDVILVGEIRDSETANIALRASLTGHLVLSTLHTNTAVGSIATLGQMHIEPYMIISALTGIITQRLLRVLCAECKKPYAPTPEMLKSLGLPEDASDVLYSAAGCGACLGTGYRGRTGVYELMPNTPVISEMILADASEPQLVEVTRRAGFLSLTDNASAELIKGTTSAREIMERLTGEA